MLDFAYIFFLIQTVDKKQNMHRGLITCFTLSKQRKYRLSSKNHYEGHQRMVVNITSYA